MTADDSLNSKSFLISLGAHLIAMIIMLVASLIWKELVKPEGFEVIQSAVRVDVVGMPKLTIKELREMDSQVKQLKEKAVEEKTPEKEIAIKKDDLVIEQKSKKSQLNDLISTYSQKKIETKVQKKVEGGELIEGNKLSSGTSLVGDYSDGPQSPFALYVQQLPGLIRKSWSLPTYLLEQNLKCRIHVFIGKKGELVSLSIKESSGHSEFDQRAMSAVKKSAPFPIPEKDVAKRLISAGVILGFPI